MPPNDPRDISELAYRPPAREELAAFPPLPDEPGARPPGLSAARLLGHALAAVLFLIAAFCIADFLRFQADPRPGAPHGLWHVFPSLFKPYAIDWKSMDWPMLGWSLGAVAIFCVVGWFFLETLELYIPLTAQLALAFLMGMGLCGFLFEGLAMAGLLNRTAVFIAVGALLAILWPLAIWGTRRRPEAWGAGEGGAIEQDMRCGVARSAYDKSIIWPRLPREGLFAAAALFLIAAITFALYWHALLFPETYWDSLILYLGYARMMFYEHSIIRKVVGQVGIGLGANYPHLYSLLGSAASLAGNQWSELPQRLIAPTAGLASTVLVFHCALRLTRHFNFSLAVALLYRAIPIGLLYDQYASDYCLTILFCAAFLYAALLYIDTGLFGYFILATAIIACGMHLNYLMGILWGPWALMILCAHLLQPASEDEAALERLEEATKSAKTAAGASLWIDTPVEEPEWTRRLSRLSLRAFLLSPRFIATFALCALFGSTWLLRNWIVTGNPVYAFFPKIFGGMNINPEVMESAGKEWLSHGDGIGRMGDTLWERVRGSWAFFMDQRGWSLAWKTQPFFIGFAFPGALLLLARVGANLLRKKTIIGPDGEELKIRTVDYGARFGLVAFATALALLAFHYMLAAYYLYQIVMILPALAALAAFAFPHWRAATGWRLAFGALVLLVGVMPGLAMGLMGFKLVGPVPGRMGSSPLELYAFRNALPEPQAFYRWRFGPDANMVLYVNGHLKRKKLLTHENRHLLFDPTIELVHLDDWAMQQEVWGRPPAEQIQALKALGITHYLRVENEAAHKINARMDAAKWPGLGLVEEEFRAGANILYRIR